MVCSISVKINMDNTIGHTSSFAKVPEDYDVDYETGYDFSSVMHYDSLGFSTNYWGKARTMSPVDPMMLTSMGDRSRLSFNDAKRINLHYKCIEKNCRNSSLPQNCKNGGYQDPLNCGRCRCPFGTSGTFCETIAGSMHGPDKCGGEIVVEPCSSTIIKSPQFPLRYQAGTDGT